MRRACSWTAGSPAAMISAALGGLFAVPGRHHAARPLDDRDEGDDVVRFDEVSITRSTKPAASAQ